METVVWLLNGAPVLINNDDPSAGIGSNFSPAFLRDGKHRLHVKNAFDMLSQRQLTIPTTVTVEDLYWPVKAIVEPNRGRLPQWAVHVRHRLLATENHDKLSPFVMIDRERKLPITKALTLELTGTLERPVLTNVYPGSAIPPLPWQLSPKEDAAKYQHSVEFWQHHSFLYDKHHAGKSQSPPPSWYTTPSCSPLQPR